MGLNKFVDMSGDWLYLLFRLFVGGFFLSHGLGKFLPGFIGPGDIAGFAAFAGVPVWLAAMVGIGEIVTGAGIILGLFVRPLAIVGILIMLGALVMVHFKMSLNPLSNGAELPMVYIGAFLVLLVYGARKWSLEKAMMKRELFWE